MNSVYSPIPAARSLLGARDPFRDVEACMPVGGTGWPRATGRWAVLVCLLLLNVPGAWAQSLLGPKDFRISHAGPDGDARFDAAHEAVAFNSLDEQYFVVWDANDVIPSPTPNFGGKREVFGMLLDAQGAALSTAIKINSAGPANDVRWRVGNPEVVYNSIQHEYLVVFEQTIAVSPIAAKTEILAKRFSAAGVALAPAVRVSFTGLDNNVARDSTEPAVVFNSTTNEYLVAFQFEQSDTGSAAENEIYAQRLSGITGQRVSGNFRVSRMGPDGSTRFDAQDPAVAFASQSNEYLVVWRADDDSGGLVDGEFEIFGQRLLANGSEIGADDFRISQAGPNGDTRFRVEDPSVAYDSVRHRYLVTWTGNHALAQGEEIFGQLMNVNGGVVRNDFRISTMGPAGNLAYDVNETITRYNPVADEYLVAWLGEDDRELLVVDEREVFAQRISPVDGTEIGIDDFRVSDAGPQGSSLFDAFSLDVAINAKSGEVLVVWAGDDDQGSLIDGETEIFGQRLTVDQACDPTPTALCLSNGRFRVSVEWAANGDVGEGQAIALTADTGYFWFFTDNNIELVIKVLDARVINGNFWVFYGALSDVAYTITVVDSESGAARSYANPAKTFASRGDTEAFSGLARTPNDAPFELRALPQEGLSSLMSAANFSVTGFSATSVAPVTSGAGTCLGTSEALCLADSRFQVEVEWTANGDTGVGQAVQLTPDTGYFWFFTDNNVELVIKVLDARVINGHFWVFYGALSDVEYTIQVTDTVTSQVRTYANPPKTFASRGDTEAF